MEFLELCQEFFLIHKPIFKAHGEISIQENVKKLKRELN